jgi:hypothetical protein
LIKSFQYSKVDPNEIIAVFKIFVSYYSGSMPYPGQIAGNQLQCADLCPKDTGIQPSGF